MLLHMAHRISLPEIAACYLSSNLSRFRLYRYRSDSPEDEFLEDRVVQINGLGSALFVWKNFLISDSKTETLLKAPR